MDGAFGGGLPPAGSMKRARNDDGDVNAAGKRLKSESAANARLDRCMAALDNPGLPRHFILSAWVTAMKEPMGHSEKSFDMAPLVARHLNDARELTAIARLPQVAKLADAHQQHLHANAPHLATPAFQELARADGYTTRERLRLERRDAAIDALPVNARDPLGDNVLLMRTVEEGNVEAVIGVRKYGGKDYNRSAKELAKRTFAGNHPMFAALRMPVDLDALPLPIRSMTTSVPPNTATTVTTTTNTTPTTTTTTTTTVTTTTTGVTDTAQAAPVTRLELVQLKSGAPEGFQQDDDPNNWM